MSVADAGLRLLDIFGHDAHPLESQDHLYQVIRSHSVAVSRTLRLSYQQRTSQQRREADVFYRLAMALDSLFKADDGDFVDSDTWAGIANSDIPEVYFGIMMHEPLFFEPEVCQNPPLWCISVSVNVIRP